ncbi:MAG: cyclodeaminase/cyclohydrolase family protein [Planctomycetota bacterium]|nr:cyclodeaminase/cyclohydrolase family protein [Planctomycetota bacterium]
MESALAQLIAEFGGPTPLPAGGAAGVAAIAMGAALGTKVLRISGMPQEGTELSRLLDRLTPQYRTDCDAFESVLLAMKLPREAPGKEVALEDAWLDATRAPVQVAGLAQQIEEVLEGCQGRVKVSVAGDLSSALCLTRAGREIAEGNARENALRLDPEVAREVLSDLG